MFLRSVTLSIFLCLFALPLTTGIAQTSFTDDLNRIVVLPSSPKRIVSLAPSITETFFAVGAGEQVVGVTDYCNYPEEANKKARIGGVVNPNIETIVSLKPDLIILSMEGNVREDFAKLTGLNIPVFVTNPRNLLGIYKSINDLGEITGHADEAEILIDGLRTRERRIAASMRQHNVRTVMLIVSLQPLIVVGSKTFIGELIALAGGLNIARSSPATYPTYSRESVIEENPDVIIAMSDAVKDVADLTNSYPEWAQLSAIQNKKIFRIDSDIISRPGPRAIDALEALYNLMKFDKD